jgi:multiple sugar transport system ATP-binding protein
MADRMQVRFDRVAKRFGQHAALHDVDLEIEAGECMVLLGPSGCGKTTLLRLLAGLETPDSGRILIGDRVVNDVPPAERDVAMVFQNYALYPHMSVFENIAFPLIARRVNTGEIRPRVLDVARRLELSDWLDRRPAQLSGGQQQRVALARAIVRNPVVYLMDEPLSNLDAQLRVQTRAELKRLQQELGTTTIHVTHDQAEAMTLGRRVAILRNGRIEQIGPPLDLYRKPVNRFVAEFLGSPAINVWPGSRGSAGEVESAGTRLPVSTAQLAALSRASRFEVGVRPEDIRLRTEPEAGWSAGRVLIVEPVGNETLVTLTSGAYRIVARVGPEFPLQPGSDLWFSIDAGRALFFDADSGKRL